MSAKNYAINSYQRVGVESGVASADSHKLILMLFEGSINALSRAKQEILHNNIAAKGEMISKAISIIDNGLKASLDITVGGEIANNLQTLYEYMTRQLLIANIQNNIETINEIIELLSQLQQAWGSIGNKEPTKPNIHQVSNAHALKPTNI
ncbi:MAG: flagellar export chaperone FliS [Nitrosomonas sp.]|nr:flagellar export chaperone FliS [Nitrosomonas sp.]MBK7363521.1 flagellar export chaperone FliS [Nitrosomonas sp.]